MDFPPFWTSTTISLVLALPLLPLIPSPIHHCSGAMFSSGIFGAIKRTLSGQNSKTVTPNPSRPASSASTDIPIKTATPDIPGSVNEPVDKEINVLQRSLTENKSTVTIESASGDGTENKIEPQEVIKVTPTATQLRVSQFFERFRADLDIQTPTTTARDGSNVEDHTVAIKTAGVDVTKVDPVVIDDTDSDSELDEFETPLLDPLDSNLEINTDQTPHASRTVVTVDNIPSKIMREIVADLSEVIAAAESQDGTGTISSSQSSVAGSWPRFTSTSLASTECDLGLASIHTQYSDDVYSDDIYDDDLGTPRVKRTGNGQDPRGLVDRVGTIDELRTQQAHVSGLQGLVSDNKRTVAPGMNLFAYIEDAVPGPSEYEAQNSPIDSYSDTSSFGMGVNPTLSQIIEESDFSNEPEEGEIFDSANSSASTLDITIYSPDPVQGIHPTSIPESAPATVISPYIGDLSLPGNITLPAAAVVTQEEMLEAKHLEAATAAAGEGGSTSSVKMADVPKATPEIPFDYKVPHTEVFTFAGRPASIGVPSAETSLIPRIGRQMTSASIKEFVPASMAGRVSSPDSANASATAKLRATAKPFTLPSSSARTEPLAPIPAKPAAVSDGSKQSNARVWIGPDSVEPFGIPLPSTYADVTNLILKFPELSREIRALPLRSSTGRSPGVLSPKALLPGSNDERRNSSSTGGTQLPSGSATGQTRLVHPVRQASTAMHGPRDARPLSGTEQSIRVYSTNANLPPRPSSGPTFEQTRSYVSERERAAWVRVGEAAHDADNWAGADAAHARQQMRTRSGRSSDGLGRGEVQEPKRDMRNEYARRAEGGFAERDDSYAAQALKGCYADIMAANASGIQAPTTVGLTRVRSVGSAAGPAARQGRSPITMVEQRIPPRMRQGDSDVFGPEVANGTNAGPPMMQKAATVHVTTNNELNEWIGSVAVQQLQSQAGRASYQQIASPVQMDPGLRSPHRIEGRTPFFNPQAVSHASGSKPLHNAQMDNVDALIGMLTRNSIAAQGAQPATGFPLPMMKSHSVDMNGRHSEVNARSEWAMDAHGILRRTQSMAPSHEITTSPTSYNASASNRFQPVKIDDQHMMHGPGFGPYAQMVGADLGRLSEVADRAKKRNAQQQQSGYCGPILPPPMSRGTMSEAGYKGRRSSADPYLPYARPSVSQPLRAMSQGVGAEAGRGPPSQWLQRNESIGSSGESSVPSGGPRRDNPRIPLVRANSSGGQVEYGVSGWTVT